jgi:hypothetical protein
MAMVLLYVVLLIVFLVGLLVAGQVRAKGADHESRWIWGGAGIAIFVALAAVVIAILALVWAVLPTGD